MKAYVRRTYGAPSVLSLEDVPTPDIQPKDVLVKVRAVSINPLDWHILRGTPRVLVRPVTGWRRPKRQIIGADVAGVIVAKGTAVTDFNIGDEVFADLFPHGMGAFAEYVRIPAKALARKPAEIGFAAAAATPIAGLTAWHALQQCAVLPGQSVLINGASGGVGTFAVQLAKAMGARVTGVCSARNLDMVRSLGADHVVDYQAEDFTRLDQRFDVMVDNVCDRTPTDFKQILRPGGRGVLVGFYSVGQILRQMFWTPLASRAGSRKFGPLNWKYKPEDLEHLARMFVKGTVKPVIDRAFGFEELPEAVAYVEGGRARGKVVVLV
ncbi:MAG: NAD(P)-dependent alcohol dehydrogenase [Bacteroidota bacterium]